MKKCFVSLLLALVLCVSCTGLPAFAALTPDRLAEATAAADDLQALGLFAGTENGYELDGTADRAQAITMLINLIGKRSDALDKQYPHPFTDVPQWADAFVGYAYAKGLTSGVSATQFGAEETATPRQYLVFLLRALGSYESQQFFWDGVPDCAREIGLTQEGELEADAHLTRADMAILSRRALDKEVHGTGRTLRDILTNPEDTGYVPSEQNGEASDVGGQMGRNAGEFATVQNIAENRTVWDGTTDTSVIRAELNRYCGFPVYGYRFFPSGIALNQGDGEDVMKFVTDGHRVGINIFSWRQSYDSNSSVNAQLNMAMEAFWYMSGSRKFAHALWSWMDAASINGTANSDDYGFRDVATTDRGFRIAMDGIEVELEPGDGTNTIWFSK